MIQEKETTKVFITGGTGFIGRHLVKELDNGLTHFYILSNTEVNIAEFSQNITFIFDDLFNLENHLDKIKQCGIFIHIAGEKKDEAKMHLVNVEGTKLVMKIIALVPELAMIYISSAGIYGIHNHPEKNITESSPCYPNNTYEKTKFLAEGVVTDYATLHNIKHVILRPTNVIGTLDPNKRLLNLMQKIKNKKFYLLDKNAMVNYVYITYLTQIIKEFIEKGIFTNTTFNVNSPVLLNDVISQIQKSMGNSNKIKTLPLIAKPLIFLIAKISDFLPTKFQFLNTIKYKELTNKKIYSADKIISISTIDNKKSLFSGLDALVKYYKENNWL